MDVAPSAAPAGRVLYRVLIRPFDASLLRQGDNTVTLLAKPRPGWTGYRYAAVIYDALRMEVDPHRPYVKML